MAWTTPAPWDVGVEADAAFLNEQIRDNLLALYNAPVCVLNRSSSQALSAGETAVGMDTEVTDPDGMHTGSSDTITLNRDGLWWLSGYATLGSGSAGYRYLRVGPMNRQHSGIGSGGNVVRMSVGGFESYASSTGLKLYVGTQVALTVEAGARFAVQWLAGAA